MMSITKEDDSDLVVDFESSGGKLVSFDDGHVPETFRNNNNKSLTDTRCQLVQYEAAQQQHHRDDVLEKQTHGPPEATNTCCPSGVVHVFDNVLPSELVETLYERTLHEGAAPWGTYVTLDEAREYWENTKHNVPSTATVDDVSTLNNEEHQQKRQELLSIQAVAYFLARVMSSDGNNATWSINTSGLPLFSSWEQLQQEQVHGVAVWALSSDVSSQVQYHLDYAELIRYEHGVIVPPLYAGTIQCSAGEMEGGDFAVQLGGLSHYARHGFKGMKSGDEWGEWTQPPPVASCTDVHCNNDTSWVTIPYRYNRGICHTGHLPHLSTPIKFLEQGQKRIILGFNVFCKDIGELVRQAPEHSNAFRRRIQLHRALLKNRSEESAAAIPIDRIRQNKGLGKLLVLAKREKIKQQLCQSQRQLDDDIDCMLMSEGDVRLSTLMLRLGKGDGQWPNAVDVQVHIHHRVRKSLEGRDRIRCSCGPLSRRLDDQGILSPDVTLYLEPHSARETAATA